MYSFSKFPPKFNARTDTLLSYTKNKNYVNAKYYPFFMASAMTVCTEFIVHLYSKTPFGCLVIFISLCLSSICRLLYCKCYC